MKAEMKRLRQQLAKTSNEIYVRTQKEKATTKEKELLNQLKKLMVGVVPTTRMLKEYKKSWINKLRYKKIRGIRIMDNADFERDPKNFFRIVEGGTDHVGQGEIC